MDLATLQYKSERGVDDLHIEEEEEGGVVWEV